jgi:hypothetical protein
MLINGTRAATGICCGGAPTRDRDARQPDFFSIRGEMSGKNGLDGFRTPIPNHEHFHKTETRILSTQKFFSIP